MLKLFYYKMREFYYKMRQLLQIAKILLQNPTVITKSNVCYKLRQYRCKKNALPLSRSFAKTIVLQKR